MRKKYMNSQEPKMKANDRNTTRSADRKDYMQELMRRKRMKSQEPKMKANDKNTTSSADRKDFMRVSADRKDYMWKLMRKKLMKSQEAEMRASKIFGERESSVKTKQDVNQCNLTITELIEQFQNKVKSGPEYVCTCCDHLWYRSSVIKCPQNLYKTCPKTLLDSCITGEKSVDNIEWICSTCHANLREGKMPSCAKATKCLYLRNLLF